VSAQSQVAADLRAAAEVLRRDGWTQGDYYDFETGCHCVLGALIAAAGGPKATHPMDLAPPATRSRFDPAVKAVIDHLGFDYGLHVVDWNDAPGRTADEVIAALLAAADAAEAQA
jgi:hypothetical protein